VALVVRSHPARSVCRRLPLPYRAGRNVLGRSVIHASRGARRASSLAAKASVGRIGARLLSRTISMSEVAARQAVPLRRACAGRRPALVARAGRHNHRLGVGLPLAAGMRLSRVPWLWRNSKAGVRRPVWVLLRCFREYRGGRPSGAQGECKRSRAQVVPAIGTFETFADAVARRSRCRTTAISC